MLVKPVLVFLTSLAAVTAAVVLKERDQDSCPSKSLVGLFFLFVDFIRGGEYTHERDENKVK